MWEMCLFVPELGGLVTISPASTLFCSSLLTFDGVAAYEGISFVET